METVPRARGDGGDDGGVTIVVVMLSGMMVVVVVLALRMDRDGWIDGLPFLLKDRAWTPLHLSRGDGTRALEQREPR